MALYCLIAWRGRHVKILFNATSSSRHLQNIQAPVFHGAGFFYGWVILSCSFFTGGWNVIG